MNMRHSSWLLGLCIAIAGAALLSPAAAQAPAPDGEQWVVPRTPEGHPDLQGNWTNSTLTPFERQEGRGPVFTWEEVAELERGDGVCPPNPGTVECGRASREGASNEARLSGNEYNEVYWERGTRIAIINGEPRTSLVTHPANGRVPARTPEAQRLGQERRDFRSQFGQYDHPELRPFAERCILFGSPLGPPMQPVGAYNSNYTIVQTADYVMIMSEMVHDTRIIRIGEPGPIAKSVRPYFGNSWGRWEGDALVVETTDISPQQRIRGVPLSEEAVVIERFTRVDEETIVYEFTVDDPTMFTEPWGGEIPINKFHANLYEYACHEGNYALANVLSGARYQERQTGRN
ncbi:MAG: hypothetical protein IIB36_16170 [Gemmatimonadetes bacterium]|nr:hypothetical protein [Gemmatimonadota bacterium]